MLLLLHCIDLHYNNVNMYIFKKLKVESLNGIMRFVFVLTTSQDSGQFLAELSYFYYARILV